MFVHNILAVIYWQFNDTSIGDVTDVVCLDFIDAHIHLEQTFLPP